MGYRRYHQVNMNPLLIIIGINVVVYFLTASVPNLLLDLGLYPAGFTSRPWTIVTSMFVHSGLWHIFANMLALYFFGGSLLRLLGEKPFYIIYLVGGIIGGVFYILLGPSQSLAVGASGAVFALGGALAVLQPQMRVMIFPIPIPMPLWIAVIGGFLVLSFMPNVAWQAHLGGMLFGIVYAYILKRKRRYY